MLVATLTGCLTFGRPSRVYAIGPELFAAVPVSWPVVVAVLIGAGVVTAIYYNSLPIDERTNILDAITDALVDRGLTLTQQAAVDGAIAINAVGSYIRGAIVDGKSYISKSVTDTMMDVASDLGLTGGYSIGNPKAGTYNGLRLGDLGVISIQDMCALAGLSSVSANLIAKYNEVGAENYYSFIFVYPSGTFNLQVCTGLSLNQTIVNPLLVNNYYTYNVTNKYVGDYYSFNTSGTYTGTGRFTSSQAKVYFATSEGAVYVGNRGSIETTGAPVGELGQAIEQDGAWSYPVPEVDIDNYGKSIGVSTAEDVIGIDGVARAWDADVAYPDIALSDVTGDTAIDVPTSLTQAKAAEGVADEPVAIADSPVVPDVGSLLVPEWVKDRFPFCIPFDLMRLLQKFRGSGTTAPVIDMHVPIGGEDMHIYFDLAYFDPVCQVVRYGIYLFFLVDLMKGTREMIGW